tara:strand:+ start:31 stop:480 length:450 start_codon:yes stop_codon:yes gene_type:complete
MTAYVVTMLKATEHYLKWDKFIAIKTKLSDATTGNAADYRILFQKQRNNFADIRDKAIPVFKSAIVDNKGFIQGHQSMKVYMCENFQRVVDLYKLKLGGFIGKVEKYNGQLNLFNFSAKELASEHPIHLVAWEEFVKEQAPICKPSSTK